MNEQEDVPITEASKTETPATCTGKSTTSLVLGILSLVFWLLPLFGLPISIVGLVFGIRRKYTAGIVLNIIGLCLTVINAALGAYIGVTGQMDQMFR